MNKANLFPLLTSVSLNPPRTNENKFTELLFNPKTNKGFSVEGLAAMFCKKLDGNKTLEQIINDFENEYQIESGKFNSEIEILLVDLEKHELIQFLTTPKLK